MRNLKGWQGRCFYGDYARLASRRLRVLGEVDSSDSEQECDQHYFKMSNESLHFLLLTSLQRKLPNARHQRWARAIAFESQADSRVRRMLLLG